MTKRFRDIEEEPLRLVECVNPTKLQYIMENIDTVMVAEERTKFAKYAALVKKDAFRCVTYSKSGEKGRVYADGALSMQGFSKGVRSLLAHGIYHDIDMSNCHPVFLLQVCMDNGWQDKCDNLRHYVENREQVLQEICSVTKCTRNDAKKLMLTLMYGGKIETWKRKFGNPPKFVDRYAKELTIIASLVFKRYPDFPVTNVRNPVFSKMSLLLQDIEHETLMVLSRSLREHGYIPGVYLFDGVMVYRLERNSTDTIDKTVLLRCQEIIREKLGYNVTLEEKQI